MHLVIQQLHHLYVQPGPLVLGSALLKYPTPATDKDRTVSRRSEPSSRTALMGEQPNGSLRPTFVSDRHVCLPVKLPSAFALYCAISVRAEETFARLRYSFGGDRPSQTARLTLSSDQFMITS